MASKDPAMAGSGPPPPPAGFSVGVPPPSGQPQQVSWKLSYVDFWPSQLSKGGMFQLPTYEMFGVCVQRANQWLQQNPNIEIVTCESAEVRVGYGASCDPESTVFYVSGNMRTCFLRGLRLWIQPRATPGPPIQIAYVNTVPGMRRSAGFLREAEFERLPDVLATVNKMFKERPLPGKILTIETQDMKLDANFSGSMSISPDQSMWGGGGNVGRGYLFVLRIFYICGPPCYEEIGMVDFLPKCLASGGFMKLPSFEGFTSICNQAYQWIHQYQQTIRITNVQSIDIKMLQTGFSSSSLQIDSQKMNFFEAGKTATCFLRCLRVCYTKPSNEAPVQPAPPMNLWVKVFYPVQLSNAGLMKMPQFETFSQTMQRANAWLSLVGRRILSVETIPLNMTAWSHMAQAGGGTGAECSFVVGAGNNAISFQYVIRVYLDGPFQEPPANQLPPLPACTQNVRHWSQEKQECSVM